MPRPPFNPLPRFLLGLLLIVPLCLALWWFIARDGLVFLLEYAVRFAVQRLLAEHIVDLNARDGIWFFTTSLSTIDKPLSLIIMPIPATRFTISLPLFWGLILATPGAARLRQLLIGSLILIPIILLMVLIFIQFKLGLYINHQAALTEAPDVNYVLALPYPDYLYHLMGVGRQLALLVLPTLSPLLVWGLLNKTFIRSVILEGLLTRMSNIDIRREN